jgi:hypothetical protein
VALTSSTVHTTAHTWTTTDTLYGRRHTRTVTVNDARHTLRVIDTYTGTGGHRQTFHLDPAWVLASQSTHRLTFIHPSGRRLTLATSGALSSVAKGQTHPIAGWTFPRRSAKVANLQVFLQTRAARIDTTLTVSPTNP